MFLCKVCSKVSEEPTASILKWLNFVSMVVKQANATRCTNPKCDHH